MARKTVSAIMMSLLVWGTLALAFDIQPVKASGTIYIRADGSIDPPDAPISTVDNVTYTFTGNIFESIAVERDNIIMDGKGYPVQGTSTLNSRGIDLSGRENVTVKNTQIKDFYHGIYFSSSSNNNVYENSLTSNDASGIYFSGSSDNHVYQNNITLSGVGIRIYSSSNNSAYQNNIVDNGCGIGFSGSSSNNVYQNNITSNNMEGIFLGIYSSNNNVYQNNIANNYYGIYLYSSSDNNVSGNNITANSGDGIVLGSSSNNIIYHNNFMNNAGQAYSSGLTNVWDDGYPSGGNYWSDYTGIDLFSGPYQNDTGSDGIGDAPYTIGANDQDRYPLMTTWASEVAFIQVTATSPHVANGMDVSSVVATAKDAYGNPVVGVNILLYLFDGYDSVWTSSVVDNGDGTHSTFVNSTTAGEFSLMAVDLETGVAGYANITFLPGPVTDIYVTATKPRESALRNASDLVAVAIDEFGNTVPPPLADITMTTDLGTVTPAVFEFAAFRSTLMFGGLGIADVTAIEIESGTNRTIQVVFPAMYISPPEGLVIVGNFLTEPVNIYVSDPNRALGYYDLTFSFNSSIVSFVNITDGDPTDEFATPFLEMINNDTIRINQSNVVSMSSPTGNVNIANITFEAVEAGLSPVNMTLWNNSEWSLLDTNGVPLPSIPNIGEDPNVKQKKKEICLKIHTVKGSGVNPARVNADVAYAKKVFEGKKAIDACLSMEIKVCQPIGIDEIDDNALKDINFRGLKEGEASAMDNKISAEMKKLLGANFAPNCVNIYYVENFSPIGSIAYTVDRDSFPSEPNLGIIMSSGALTRSLAHELGHFLIQYPYDKNYAEHNEQDVKTGTVTSKLVLADNIMAQSSRSSATKAEDENLTGDQAKKMMKHDFGDAPDGPYPSLKNMGGASHCTLIYEWLGKAADDELDSRQVDQDRYDDGVVIEGNLIPGGNLKLTITISTNAYLTAGRYDINNPNKVMYLNAWVDWNHNGWWATPDEKIIGTGSPEKTQKFAGPTTKVYNIPIPLWVNCTYTWFRFRLDYAEDAGANKQPWTDRTLNQERGQARYGEVEDYMRVRSGPSWEVQWLKTYGQLFDDGCHSVIQTDDGYALVGRTSKHHSKSDYDAWVIKTDADGNVQWNKTYGGEYDDEGHSVIQTSDGGYLILGQTTSSAGDYDAWVIKTDVDGNVQWNKTYGGEYDDVAISLIPKSGGGYAFSGYTYSFGPSPPDYARFWLVLINANGDVERNSVWGDPGGNMYCFDMIQRSDGWYILAGSNDAYGNGDFWLSGADPSGIPRWNTTYGGSEFDEAYSLIQTSDGGLAIVGVSYSFGAGSADIWLLKTDSVGNPQWGRTYGGTNFDCAFSLVQTIDGGYALGGYTNSSGAGANDFWLVRTDSSGDMLGNKTYGGTDNDECFSIARTADGGYVLAGRTASFGSGGCDFLLIKLVPEGVHEVAVADVTSSKTVVGEGFSLNVNVTAANRGDYTETFNVTVYVNTTEIETREITLTSGNFTTFTFTWNTTSTPKGNYTISAYAWPVLGETYTADNNFTDGSVVVTVPGDVDGNFKVDMGDISALCDGFGSTIGAEGYYWHKPPCILCPHSPNLDIDGNGQVDMGDIVTALDHFGKHYP